MIAKCAIVTTSIHAKIYDLPHKLYKLNELAAIFDNGISIVKVNEKQTKQDKMSDGLESSTSLPEHKKGGMNPKVFLIGIPLFIVQLVAVYFVTANILLSKMPQGAVSGATAAEEKAEGEEGEKKSGSKGEIGKNIYTIEGIVVNPAGTNGQRIIATSIGFDLPAAEEIEKFKSKEVLVKDIVISTLSGKTLSQLGSIQYRDSLKSEITKTIMARIPQLKINSIYFSQYIIQ